MPRPTTLPEPWRSLAAKLGGVEVLATALGTTRRTLDHWARGDRSPSGTSRQAIRAMFEAHGFESPV